MSKYNVEFQIPYRVSFFQVIIQTLVYLLFLFPPFIAIVLLKYILKETELIDLGIHISIGFGAVMFLWMVYTRSITRIPDKIYREYIIEHIRCPKCKNKLSRYERSYPRASHFSEYYYICDFCNTRYIIDSFGIKGATAVWKLAEEPDSEKIERFKEVVESADNEKELVEGLSKSSLKKENIELLNRAYTLRYGVYKQLRYDQKVRKMAYLLLAILIAIGFLVYRYGILPTYLIIPTFSFVYVITLIFLAWREEKKMG